MLRSQIIDYADRRTERRSANNSVLHLGQEYANAIAEFCNEHHFHWRKKTATFVTDGSATYDLSDGSMSDMDEIAEVYYVKSDGTVVPLLPIEDPETQAEALAATYTETEPCEYMPALNGDEKTIRIFPATTGHNIRVTYWAIPVIDQDDSEESVPLVPSQYHRLIAKCMEKNMGEFLYGAADSRVIAATKAYYKGVEDAKHTSHNFSTTIQRRIKSGSDYYNTSAIRSTR